MPTPPPGSQQGQHLTSETCFFSPCPPCPPCSPWFEVRLGLNAGENTPCTPPPVPLNATGAAPRIAAVPPPSARAACSPARPARDRPARSERRHPPGP